MRPLFDTVGSSQGGPEVTAIQPPAPVEAPTMFLQDDIPEKRAKAHLFFERQSSLRLQVDGVSAGYGVF